MIKSIIGNAEQWLIESAKEIGLNLKGFKHEITSDFINHVLKNHGDEASEKNRGNAAVTITDLGSIPEIIKSPDYAVIGAKRKNTNLIIYAKKMKDNSTLYFEEILDSKKQKSLRGKTMFKLRGLVSENKFKNIIINNNKTDITNAKKIGLGGTGSYPSGATTIEESPAAAIPTLPLDRFLKVSPRTLNMSSPGSQDLAGSQEIEKNSGKVVDTITMANGARGLNAALAVTPAHILELERKYSVELLQRFLKEEQLYGGNHKALTDAEARTLLGAASLDEARDRIVAARQEGIHRTRPEIFQGTSADPESLNTETRNTDHSNPLPQNTEHTFTAALSRLKSAYTGALLRHGIKSDEAQQAYQEYKRYELVKKFDPIGVRKGQYDDAGQVDRMIKSLQPFLNRQSNRETTVEINLKEKNMTAYELKKQRDELKEVLEGEDVFKETGQTIDSFEEVGPEEQLDILEKVEKVLYKQMYDEMQAGGDDDIQRDYLYRLNTQRKIIQQQIDREINLKEKNMTVTELFDHVRENGECRFNDLNRSLFTSDAAKDYFSNAVMSKNGVSFDPYSSPFWQVNLEDPQEYPFPVKDENDLIFFFDKGLNIDLKKELEKSSLEESVLTLHEVHNLDPELLEATSFISHKTEELLDEYLTRKNQKNEAGISSAEISEETIGSTDVPEEIIEGRGEPKTAEEVAFLNTLHQRNVIAESLENGQLSCLPGAGGLADTSPAVNIANDTRYHGVNLLYLKDFQKRNEFPTAEYITRDQIDRARAETGDQIFIRKDQKPVTVSFGVKDEGTGEWEQKNVLLYNVAQTTKPWALKAWAEKHVQEKQQEKQDFLKQQYGDNYRPYERKEKGPGPEIACSSTEPEKYLGQYLAAVSMGGKFKVSPEQAKEFAANLKAAVFEKEKIPLDGKTLSPKQEKELAEKGALYRTDPFKLSKICQAAGQECKEVMREIGREQRQNQQQVPEQKQEQKRGRSL